MSEPSFPKFAYSKDWGAYDSYLLAKIAMAEAESCDTYTKTLVILVVLNRVWSDDFPNTIEDVIYQEVNGVYQFTPIADGRWDSVEPDDDSWNAVQQVCTIIQEVHCISKAARTPTIGTATTWSFCMKAAV